MAHHIPSLQLGDPGPHYLGTVLWVKDHLKTSYNVSMSAINYLCLIIKVLVTFLFERLS